MAEVKNAFIKSKMNKDLDDRLVPSGEYRNAVNVQVSKSEGSDVGALENALGNSIKQQFESDVANTSSIGYLVDEANNEIYVFITDNNDSSYVSTGAGSNHFIYKYNPVTNVKTKLVEGAFLNFSKLNPIYGVNLLESLLFWTDNRNQPRKINVIDAATAGYYTTEDQLSVAKYNPYRAIELFEASELSAGNYETTMKDVVTKFMPNGGSCVTTAATSGGTVVIPIDQIQIPYYPLVPVLGMTVKRVNSSGDIVPVQYQGVDIFPTVVSYSDAANTIDLSEVADIPVNTELIFNANPYYINGYNGDPRFLEDKFVRFSYRFKFDDGEYSLIAPFTQPCFIPKQDGYFLNKTVELGDMQQAYSSTVLGFMENKVNKIDLRIPLPTNANILTSSLHVTEIDILYKESDGLAIQVVETIPTNSPNFLATVGDIYEYSYQSQKPYKTLPAKETTRVYDKIPVKAFSQEIISNRVVYGNYQDKHTPPAFLNYNVAASSKSDFSSTGSVSDTTSRVEYPNSSLKTNRTYQVGIVLADKFGRQSTTVLSNSGTSLSIGPVESSTLFSGSTLYSPYSAGDIAPENWVGDSLKVIFNSTINGVGGPGLYNGDSTSPDYNPLGWYSYKVVVKQNEQEYYNVYSPGAMKGLPFNYDVNDFLPVKNNNTSFITLINDNINKVPRDLSEVGPQDKSFRSSVTLFGRVENISNDANTGNKQYYPNRTPFTTSSIEDLYDLFDTDDFKGYLGTTLPVTNPLNAFHGFFKSDSNPFIAEIVTSQSVNDQFGVNNSVTEELGSVLTSITVSNQTEVPYDTLAGVIDIGSIITSINGVPVEAEALSFVVSNVTGGVSGTITLNRAITLSNNDALGFSLKTYNDIESLAIFETTPTVSRLDIFWETSTSGLISELNTAILTQDNGAAFISDFNLTPFTEAISNAGSYILQSDFTIADILGTNIPAGNFDQDITMTVQDNQSTPQSVNNLFTLVKIDANLQNYNIAVTQDFIDSVYFGDDAGLRNFTFFFDVYVNGNDVEVFEKQANLTNVVPIIISNGDINIDRGTNVTSIANLSAVNGAFGDATILKNKNGLDWDIMSGNDDGYFSLENSNTDTCTLRNDYPSTIPATSYTLTVRVTDAGGSTDTIDLTVNFEANVTSVVEWRATTNVGGSDPVNYYYCIIGVSGWEQTERNGWYIYSNTWDSFNGSTKQINYTGSNKNGTGCLGSWYFNADATSVTNHWKSCVLGSNPASYSGTTIDITGVDFTII